MSFYRLVSFQCIYITWALDDVDSKELSGSLSRNAQLSEAHHPEGGILNSWAVVFNQISLANLLFKSKQQKKNLAQHQGMLKEKASLPDDMRRSKTPVLKLPQGLDGNSVTYYRLGSTNSPSKRPLVALKELCHDLRMCSVLGCSADFLNFPPYWI